VAFRQRSTLFEVYVWIKFHKPLLVEAYSFSHEGSTQSTANLIKRWTLLRLSLTKALLVPRQPVHNVFRYNQQFSIKLLQDDIFSKCTKMLWNKLHTSCTLYTSASQPVGHDPLVGREAISGGSRSISKCYSFLLDREIIALSLRNKYATM